jgi:hypothetical protein
VRFLSSLPIPRQLGARVWLVTLPSAVLSFERRQKLPKMPIGQARLAGLAVLAVGALFILRASRSPTINVVAGSGLSRLREKPAVAGGLLAVIGAAFLARSFMLAAYTFALAFAYTREAIDLEEPRLPIASPIEGSPAAETEADASPA